MTRLDWRARAGRRRTRSTGWSTGAYRWCSESGSPVADPPSTEVSIECRSRSRHTVRAGAPRGPGEEQVSDGDVRLSWRDRELHHRQRIRRRGCLEPFRLLLELRLRIGELLLRRLELLLGRADVLA